MDITDTNHLWRSCQQHSWVQLSRNRRFFKVGQALWILSAVAKWSIRRRSMSIYSRCRRESRRNFIFVETQYRHIWAGYALIDAVQQFLHINVQRFEGGLVFRFHRLCVSLNSRLESNKEDEKETLEPLIFNPSSSGKVVFFVCFGFSISEELQRSCDQDILNKSTDSICGKSRLWEMGWWGRKWRSPPTEDARDRYPNPKPWTLNPEPWTLNPKP